MGLAGLASQSAYDDFMTFDLWLAHFQANPTRHREAEATVEWDAAPTVSESERRAFIRSFQRFELGESGDGERLLVKAAAAGDPTYLAALELLVREEQKHSALFRRGLDHFDARALDSHWTDAAFTTLRRLFGLRTELGMFLIAETVAMGYFIALAERARTRCCAVSAGGSRSTNAITSAFRSTVSESAFEARRLRSVPR